MNVPIAGILVRSESFRAAAILIGILHVCFFPYIWGDKTLLASAQDSSSIMPKGAWAGDPPSAFRIQRTLDGVAGAVFGEPNLSLLHHQYFQERVAPLWNPYQAYGAPLAADQQSQAFYPLTLTLLLHIGPRTYNWFLLSRLFIAGICSYLYLRFFVSFWPGIAGGVTSMLAGYYLLFLSLPHLSVEMLIPASLLAAELLLRKRNDRSVAAFALMLLLVFLGGMPESALLLLTLLYSYILLRIVSDPALRSSWLTAMARLLAGTCSGLALSAFFLLPFWELMHRSFSIHESSSLAGLAHDPPGISVFTYFFPLLYGPPGFLFGLRNYIGLVSFFLLAIALAAVFGKRSESPPLKAITWFFACFTALLVLKRYGLAVNVIGALPFFNRVSLAKYDEALLSICVSMLAAIGLERLLRRQVSLRGQAIVLGLTALLIPAALWFSRQTLRKAILEMLLSRRFPAVAVAVPAFLILGVAVVLVLSWRRRAAAGMDVRLAVGLVALVSAEMWVNFIGPMHYWFNYLPRVTHNPYLGAPYIDAIKKVAGNYRVFARDGVLLPNWAAAFQLYDIRDLDAIYDKKYLPFVRNFFHDQKDIASRSGPYDRFTGVETYDLSAPLAKRLLQLSSVKYIASMRAFEGPAPAFQLIYDAEAKVYRYGDVLPRAAIYHHAEMARGEEEALRKLADPALDIFQSVVLNELALNPEQRTKVTEINRQAPAPVQAASIESYRSQDVQIEASLDQSGILVLNDTDYPGWTAEVDGHPAEWINANYLFRGLLLPPGKHAVRFVYRPKSFYLGAEISGTTMAVLLIVALARLKWRIDRRSLPFVRAAETEASATS